MLLVGLRRAVAGRHVLRWAMLRCLLLRGGQPKLRRAMLRAGLRRAVCVRRLRRLAAPALARVELLVQPRIGIEDVHGDQRPLVRRETLVRVLQHTVRPADSPKACTARLVGGSKE